MHAAEMTRTAQIEEPGCASETPIEVISMSGGRGRCIDDAHVL
jgi:hypothetical protein